MRKWCICACFLFTSCAPIVKYVPQPISVFPELPPVEAIPAPNFNPVHFLLPTDNTGKVLSVSDCVNTAGSEIAAQNCATNSTNIFVGLDEKDFVNLLINNQAARDYVTAALERIKQVNIERAEWSAQNKGTAK